MISQIEAKLLCGEELTFDEAVRLAGLQGKQVHQLIALAGKITGLYADGQIDLCSIINAKSGLCSEDCKFCAQSAHYHTGIKHYELLDKETILLAAEQVKARGIHRFSLVTSGKELPEDDFARALDIYRSLQKTGLKLCASLGLLDERRALQLKEAGVSTYHHNLETARSYYHEICTTHSYEQRVATIQAARRAGLKVCSGGILSVGETMQQRVELAFELKELHVDSVPINILNPIAGTPLAGQEILPPLEIIKTICLFRLVMPRVSLRFAGGRKEALGELRSLGFLAGITGAIAGDFLTTAGDEIEKEITLIKGLGYSLATGD